MKKDVVLDVNGFEIKVKSWDNHVNVEFPAKRVKAVNRGKMVELTMANVCEVFSRHFRFAEDGEGRTCLEYFENDGIGDKPKPNKEIVIEERSPRRVFIRIRGHVIRATISVDNRHSLYFLLPDNIGDDFTFHDLCRAILTWFKFNKRFKATHITCIKY